MSVIGGGIKCAQCLGNAFTRCHLGACFYTARGIVISNLEMGIRCFVSYVM